jgi:hypothetical protein
VELDQQARFAEPHMKRIERIGPACPLGPNQGVGKRLATKVHDSAQTRGIAGLAAGGQWRGQSILALKIELVRHQAGAKSG